MTIVIISKAMGSNRGEVGRTLVSSEAGMNQESVCLDLETLCEFCKRLPLGEVGHIGSSTKFANRRDIGDIVNESYCPFCREVTKFIKEWSCKALGKEVPDLGDGYRQQYGVFFQLHKVASVNRMWIWFATANFRPILQFQRCSRPPLQVSNDGSLCDWESVPKQAFSGRLRPLVADTQLFHKWKEICCSTHGGHCKSLYSGVPPAWLRLIDVEKRCVVVCNIDVEKGCLVDSEGDITYVALSYVWGQGKLSERGKLMPKLTKPRKGLFQEAGSLTREKVLSTIDDAMEVTRSLGEKYIWVDCLCIMQDDEADQGEFIPQMDSIYGFASVTIVAASGDNADAGLPGIRPNSRTCEQKPFTVKGILLLQTLDPEGSKHKPIEHYHYLEDSVWSTRGWTFQEKMASKRALIFTEEQVYWECQAATWCEDSLWKTTQDSTVYRPCFPEDCRRPWPSGMTSFGRLYRNLVVEYSRRTLTYESDGLNAFEGILNALRREASQHFLWALPTSLLHSCLTWSCDDRPIKRRETLCPVRSSNGTTHCPFPSWSWVGWDVVVKSLITQTSDFVFYYLDGKWPLQRLVATSDTQGCIAESLLLHIGRTDVTLDEIPDFVRSQSIASNILFFWSSSATLHIRQTDRAWDHQLDEPSFSYNDKDVEFEWSQMPVLEAGHKELAEFVVIWGDCPGVLRVLLVDWKDGVAYRQGLATVLASEWVKLDPIWKMISLG